MVNLLSKVTIIGVILLAVLYQFVFKTVVFGFLGHGRAVQSVNSFPNVRCQRIEIPGFEACEDMHLHEPTGHLYLACSTLEGRADWLPAVGHLDASKRSVTDRLAVLDTRRKGSWESRLKWIKPLDFTGNNGDKTFNLLGVSFLTDKFGDLLRILLVNDRPSTNAKTGELLDSSKIGANSTIEHFLTKAGSTTMQYVRTHAHPLIRSPNSVQWVSDHSFVFTDASSGKVGFRLKLDPFLGGGTVVYCDQSRCNTASSATLKLANGITRARDGLIYVAEMIPGILHIYSITGEHTLQKHDEVYIGMPIDNISIDNAGDIWAAGIPQVWRWTESSKNPRVLNPPTTIFKISRLKKEGYGEFGKRSMKVYDGEYVVEKVVEDDGSLLPGSTAVVHDSVTGKLFLSGLMSPFIAVCETR